MFLYVSSTVVFHYVRIVYTYEGDSATQAKRFRRNEVANRFAPRTTALLGDVHRSHADADGFLYLRYDEETMSARTPRAPWILCAR